MKAKKKKKCNSDSTIHWMLKTNHLEEEKNLWQILIVIYLSWTDCGSRESMCALLVHMCSTSLPQKYAKEYM